MYIYVLTNPHFKGWVKLGRTHNVQSRENQYQTGCPLRSYKMRYSKELPTSIITTIEKYFLLNFKHDKHPPSEWFKISVPTAITQIENIISDVRSFELSVIIKSKNTKKLKKYLKLTHPKTRPNIVVTNCNMFDAAG